MKITQYTPARTPENMGRMLTSEGLPISLRVAVIIITKLSSQPQDCNAVCRDPHSGEKGILPYGALSAVLLAALLLRRISFVAPASRETVRRFKPSFASSGKSTDLDIRITRHRNSEILKLAGARRRCGVFQRECREPRRNTGKGPLT